MKNESKKQGRIFVDMDGTIAEYRPDTSERFLDTGYFASLKPYESMVQAIKQLARAGIEVNVLTTVYTIQAIREKEAWLNRYLPEIAEKQRIYTPPDFPKSKYIPGGVQERDILIDDHTPNLLVWPGRGIKALNPLNHQKGVWHGDVVCVDHAEDLKKVIQRKGDRK